jgi:hypothetical protein
MTVLVASLVHHVHFWSSTALVTCAGQQALLVTDLSRKGSLA